MTIVDTGKALVRNMLMNENPGSLTFLGIGTSSASVQSGDTSLTNEYGETGTETEPNFNQVMYQIDIATNQGNGSGTVIYKEVGLSTTSGGILFSRQVFSPITKDNTIAFNVQTVVTVL